MNRLRTAFEAGDEKTFFDILDTPVMKRALAEGRGIGVLETIVMDRADTPFRRRAMAGILSLSPASDDLYNDLLYTAAHRGDGDLLHVLLLKGARVNDSGVYHNFNPNTWNNPPLDPGAQYNEVIRLAPSEIPAPHMVDTIMLAHELEEKGSSYREYARAEEDPTAMLEDALNRLEGNQDGGRRKAKKSRKGRKGRKGTKRHSRRKHHRTRRLRR